MSGNDAFGPWPGPPDGTKTGGGDGDHTTPAIIDAIPPWPGNTPDLMDQFTISGVVVPGLVTFAGELGRKLDKKNAKGSDGATITDDGADPEAIDLQVVMWTEEQWRIYCTQLLPLINPNNTKGKLKPVDVSHPILALIGVKRAYVEKTSIPKRGKVPQTVEYTIRMVGWRPEPKTATKSKSKTPDAASSSPSDLVDYKKGDAKHGAASGADIIKNAYAKDSNP